MDKKLDRIIELLEEINSKIDSNYQFTISHKELKVCGACRLLLVGDRCFNCFPIGTIEGDFGYDSGSSVKET